MREFGPRRLVADLDFSGLQRVNPKFHPSRRSARRREADVIWRLPVRQGSDIHLYLLIEFQSEIDGWMAVRTQVYQSLLWQQVIDEHRLQAGMQLPPASVAGGLQRRAALEGCDYDPGADRTVPRLDAVVLAATSSVPFVGHGRLPHG